MFSRRKDPATNMPKKADGAKLMAQMGLGVDIDSMVYGDLDNDAELEAELRALQEEDSGIRSGRNQGGFGGVKGGKADNLRSVAELDKMIAHSLRDIPDDDSDDLSDTEDPDLLAELEALDSDSESHSSMPIQTQRGQSKPGGTSSDTTVLTTLQERFEMYQQARSNAQTAGDSSKARRLDRGLQTIQDMLKQTKAGKTVSEADIPPPVVVPGASADVPRQAASDPHTASSVSPQAPARQAQPAAASIEIPRPSVISGGGQAAAVAPIPRPRTNVQSAAVQEPDSSGRLPGSGVNVAKAAVNVPPVHLRTGPASEEAADRGQRHMLVERRDQYKTAAIKAKQAGNDDLALKYMRTAKQFEAVIQAVDEGKPVDLSKIPPPPGQSVGVSVVRESTQGSAAADRDDDEISVPQLTQEDKQKLFKSPEKASSVMEALQQRLAKYKDGEEQAKQEGANSKVKRMGRIVKQYEDAIKLYKAGKSVDFDELPCPPGFPPIPAESAAATPAAAVSPSPAAASSAAVPPKVAPKPQLQKQISTHSRSEQNAAFLLDRQNQFKKAAMSAKASGDIELAKKYLRMAKGFDQMIEASKSGLPVDLAQVPPPPGPGSEVKFEIIPESGEGAKSQGDRATVYKRLQNELVQQTRTCTSNRDHFTKLGDVSSATKFDKMYQSTRKDLEALKNAYQHGDPVPRFHYETREFSLVQSCTDLGDNDLELTVVRGLNYNLPSNYSAADLSTYVRYEFPFPTDSPQQGDTDVCKGTNCPEYNHSSKLEVNRKSRSFLRLLRSSKCLKLEIWYKRGFLKSDKQLGVVNIKLQPLEDKCVYHDSFDLMEGRKAVGGKLEVKIRIRDPYVTKQVEEVKEKWLVIDHFERHLPPAAAAEPKRSAVASIPATSPLSAEGSLPAGASISVLRYEKQLLDQQIAKYQGRLKASELETLQSKGRALDKQAEDIGAKLTKGGISAQNAYIDNMTKLLATYQNDAKALAKQGNKDKLQTLLTKKKLVEKEIESLRSRLQTA